MWFQFIKVIVQLSLVYAKHLKKDVTALALIIQ